MTAARVIDTAEAGKTKHVSIYPARNDGDNRNGKILVYVGVTLSFLSVALLLTGGLLPLWLYTKKDSGKYSVGLWWTCSSEGTSQLFKSCELYSTDYPWLVVSRALMVISMTLSAFTCLMSGLVATFAGDTQREGSSAHVGARPLSATSAVLQLIASSTAVAVFALFVHNNGDLRITDTSYSVSSYLVVFGFIFSFIAALLFAFATALFNGPYTFLEVVAPEPAPAPAVMPTVQASSVAADLDDIKKMKEQAKAEHEAAMASAAAAAAAAAAAVAAASMASSVKESSGSEAASEESDAASLPAEAQSEAQLDTATASEAEAETEAEAEAEETRDVEAAAPVATEVPRQAAMGTATPFQQCAPEGAGNSYVDLHTDAELASEEEAASNSNE